MMQSRLVLTILLIMATTIFLLNATSVHGQESETTGLKFEIQVYDVNLSSDVAQLNISVSFPNLPIEVIQNITSVRAVIVNDIDSIEIPLSISNDVDLVGDSGIIPWALTGNLAKGEFFPFDAYELNFTLASILPTPFNTSKIVTTLDSFAYLKGDQELLMSRVFNTTSVGSRFLLKTDPTENPGITVHLNRILGPLGYPIFFWQLVLPIMVSYWLLAATLIQSGEKGRRDRLTVYLALFFFCPTFLLAMQGYLPLRASLSIPEVLIVALITSTAIFASFSLLPMKDSLADVIKDAVMLWAVVGSTLYFLTSLLPIFPTSALSIIGYGVLIPYLIVALLLWTWKFYSVIFQRLANKKERGLTFLGGFAIVFGLLLSILWTLSIYLLVIGGVLLVLGTILVAISRRLESTADSLFVGFGMEK